MNPTISDLHVSAALTDISVAYTQQPSVFVAPSAFPTVPVTKQADKYYIYDRGDWFRTEAKPRAPGAPIAMGGWKLATDSYFADRFGLGHPISDPERSNADPAVSNLDADATEYLTHQLMLKDEVDWVADFFATGVWIGASSTTDMTGAAAPASTATGFLQWNDVASTPIEDIRGEQTYVLSRTGQKPNTLIVGARVWGSLADHPDILDRIKHTQTGVVTTDLVASLLELDRILVATAVQNSGLEGAADSFDFVAGKAALLCYVPSSPGLKVPAAGYRFAWTGMAGAPAGGVGARIKRYRDEPRESDIVEAEEWRDFKVIGSSLGAFFTTAVA